MMEKLLNVIFNSIPKDANPIIIVLFVFLASLIYILFRANAIYDFIEKFNNRELSALQNLLANENISEKAKITLRNKIESIAYKKVTGITSDINLQKKIINYYNLADGRLKYSDFKRAFIFLKIDRNGILTIRKPNLWERSFQIYSFLASAFVFIVLSLLLLAFFHYTASVRIQIFILLLIIFFCNILFLFLSEASSIPIAQKIRNEITSNPLIIHSNQVAIKAKQITLESNQVRPYELSERELTLPDDFENKKELNHKLNKLSIEQLNSVYKFVDSLLSKEQHKKQEIPVTNEDIDRVVESYRKQNKPLPIGLAKGELTIPDDFNDPLPDEILDLFEPK